MLMSIKQGTGVLQLLAGLLTTQLLSVPGPLNKFVGVACQQLVSGNYASLLDGCLS